MQQRTHFSNSGLRREISCELVARLAPLISRRWPRPEASSSMASACVGAAGKRNDAVGTAVELDFLGRDAPN